MNPFHLFLSQRPSKLEQQLEMKVLLRPLVLQQHPLMLERKLEAHLSQP